MPNNIIDSIRLSGTTYQIQGEITVDAALDSGSTNPVENKVIYNKFDEVEQVTAAALNELNDAISGKVDTSTYNTYTAATDTALSGKQDTLVSGTNIKTINNESILGSGNIDIQGGGKAVSGGTNISITTGETADTINCTLPITASSRSIICGGYGNELLGQSNDSIIAGRNNRLYNYATAAFGHYNICSQENSSSNFGYSGNTLFSIGNGSGAWTRHNALDIRDNGDIYIADTNDTSTTNWYEKPMIKLQDALGGGSSYTAGDGIDITNDVISVTGKVDTTTYNTYTAATDTALNGKQPTLVSGTNIKTINNESILGSGNITIGGGGVIIDTELDSGSTNPVENRVIYNKIDEVEQVTAAGLNALNDNFGGLKLVKLTQAQYDALATKNPSTLYVIVD